MMTFDPSVPLWLIALLFVPVTIFLLWKEWERKLTLRILRVVAAFIMMLMLAAIFLRPYHNVTKSRRILLLTNGYNVGQIDSLVNANHGCANYEHTRNRTLQKLASPQIVL